MLYDANWISNGIFSIDLSKVKLATIVEGNPKAPFSIATTPRCRGGRYSFPGLPYFTLDPYLIMLSPDIGLGVRVFANGPGDLGSIPGRVIPKTQKMVLDASLLNTQHYKVRIKGKVEQSREGVAPSPTPWCSSYRKGSLRATLNYGRQLYLALI